MKEVANRGASFNDIELYQRHFAQHGRFADTALCQLDDCLSHSFGHLVATVSNAKFLAHLHKQPGVTLL
jgi:hypothetical protein